MIRTALNLEFDSLRNWLASPDDALLIAGPCSAETEDQVLATAHALREIPEVKLFRAGVWKPRTRPNGFEGNGEIAFEWLKRVRAETGLRTLIEVARAEHVEAALKHGVDAIWIGARTVVNPFSIQEIADALRGSDIPVLIKNPIVPDLNLWIGAIERIQMAGIRRIAAVHRGFTSYSETRLRFAPEWKIPIELRRICPNLEIICDPSHIAGRRDLVLPVAQQALDMDMAGLMIEVHVQPENAWSDAQQQLTPADFRTLLRNLRFRSSAIHDRDFSAYLETLRKRIDLLDKQLLEILFARMNVVEEIGRYKGQQDVTALQIQRWDELIRDRLELAARQGLDPGLVEEIFQLVHAESIRRQSRVMNEPATGDGTQNFVM